MKKIKTTSALAFFLSTLCVGLYGQSGDKNYVLTRTYLTTGGNIENGNQYWGMPEEVQTNVTYFDGLGRQVQQVLAFATPGMADLVIKTEYDNVFRPYRNHLPQPQSQGNGNFRTQVEEGYYSSNAVSNPTTFFYTQSQYDDSPLNRVKEVKAPGRGNEVGVRSVYKVGGAGIRNYHFSATGELITNSDYASSSLLISETLDEDNKKIEEFTDRSGRIVARRVDNSLITYYVYNQKGLLRYVLQPSYQDTGDLDRSAFQYGYDAEGRMTSKRVPGQENFTMEYDTRDRLFRLTDGKGTKYYYKYEDQNNRMTEMGVIFQEAEVPLIYHYYDNYSGPSLFAGFVNELSLTGADHFVGSPQSDNKNGLLTISRSRVLSDDGSLGGDWLETVFYYDQKSRLIQQHRRLYALGGTGNTT